MTIKLKAVRTKVYIRRQLEREEKPSPLLTPENLPSWLHWGLGLLASLTGQDQYLERLPFIITQIFQLSKRTVECCIFIDPVLSVDSSSETQ